jgi:hypothetical protein
VPLQTRFLRESARTRRSTRPQRVPTGAVERRRERTRARGRIAAGSRSESDSVAAVTGLVPPLTGKEEGKPMQRSQRSHTVYWCRPKRFIHKAEFVWFVGRTATATRVSRLLLKSTRFQRIQSASESSTTQNVSLSLFLRLVARRCGAASFACGPALGLVRLPVCPLVLH